MKAPNKYKIIPVGFSSNGGQTVKVAEERLSAPNLYHVVAVFTQDGAPYALMELHEEAQSSKLTKEVNALSVNVRRMAEALEKIIAKDR